MSYNNSLSNPTPQPPTYVRAEPYLYACGNVLVYAFLLYGYLFSSPSTDTFTPGTSVIIAALLIMGMAVLQVISAVVTLMLLRDAPRKWFLLAALLGAVVVFLMPRPSESWANWQFMQTLMFLALAHLLSWVYCWITYRNLKQL